MSHVTRICAYSKKVHALFSTLMMEEARQARIAWDHYLKGVHFQGRNYNWAAGIELHPALSGCAEMTKELLVAAQRPQDAAIATVVAGGLGASGKCFSSVLQGNIRSYDAGPLKQKNLFHDQANERKGQLRQIVDHITNLFSTLLRTASGS
ncbi:MAG: hypothetical protein ACOYK9_02000 [Chlamydiia bacterium]